MVNEKKQASAITPVSALSSQRKVRNASRAGYQENWEEPLLLNYLKVYNRVFKRGVSPSFHIPPPSPEGEGGHRGMGLLAKTGE